jgi:sulfur relay (sulfurtransferase) complex TusBCD TusD component (DsrE family)
MRIGVVITDDKYINDAAGLLEAASLKGFETECFLSDRGVLLLNFNNFTDFVNKINCKVAVCEYSIERLGETKNIEKFKDKMTMGGQYHDAELVSRSDRVIVF